jgi:hypothetical protein
MKEIWILPHKFGVPAAFHHRKKSPHLHFPLPLFPSVSSDARIQANLILFYFSDCVLDIFCVLSTDFFVIY